jgi:mercuric transport protein
LQARLLLCSLGDGKSFDRQQTCSAGEVCAVPRTRRVYKILFVAIFVLVLIAVVFPYVIKFFYWVSRNKGMVMKNLKTSIAASVAIIALAAPAWAPAKTVTLNVSGMTCEACPITVKKALQKVPGVSKIDVLYEKKQVPSLRSRQTKRLHGTWVGSPGIS